MNKTALIFLAPVLALAACGDDTPPPSPSNNMTELNSMQPAEGGPCGDGTVLGPNERCK
jgi:hypothetical protein